jgi:hypothetical protein
MSVMIPKDKLREGRNNALKKVKRERIRNKSLFTVSFLAIFCLIFVTSIRVSPTIAGFAAKIPGLAPVVQIINDNKGFEDAIAHDYYEEIGAIATKDGITVTINGVIIDEYNAFVSYDLDYVQPTEDHDRYNVRLFQENQELIGSMAYNSFYDKNKTLTHSSHTLELDIYNGHPLDSDNYKLQLEFLNDEKTVIEIPFTLKNPIAKTKVIEPNKVIEIDGQRFTIKSIKRTPLRMFIEVEPDPNNTMQIIHFENVSITLQNGEKRETIINGVIGTGSLREGTFTMFLQSNYFYESEELTLTIEAIHAVPKDDEAIIVDFATQQIIHKPSYIDWPMWMENNKLYVKAPVKNHHGYSPFDSGYKEDGTVLYPGSGEFHVSDEEGYNYVIYYPKYHGIVTIPIHHMYKPLSEGVEVKFKLK